MKSNEVELLLHKIQSATRQTLDDIADTIKVSRPYLSKVKKRGEGDNIIRLLKKHYADSLKEDDSKTAAIINSRLIELEARCRVFEITLIELLSGAEKKSSAVVASELKKAILNEREMLMKEHGGV